MAIEQLIPPDASQDVSAPPEALAYQDGGFSNSEHFVRPTQITPTDRLTKLPLPIFPTGDSGNSDWHHHFHPRRSPILQRDLGGHAVRNARLQLTDQTAQHLRYHQWYEGPLLPETEEEQFATIIMAVAGYIPTWAIAFRGSGKPYKKKLHAEQRDYLQTGGVIKLGGRTTIESFIKQYVMSQEIDSLNISALAIEEFVTTDDIERRIEIGRTLLGLITEQAVTPIKETYSKARKHELILPGLPKNAQRFTKKLLSPTISIRDRLIDQLHAELVV